MLWYHVLFAAICSFSWNSAGAAVPLHSPGTNSLSFSELNYYEKTVGRGHDDCVDRVQKRQSTTDASGTAADISSYRFYDNETARKSGERRGVRCRMMTAL